MLHITDCKISICDTNSYTMCFDPINSSSTILIYLNLKYELCHEVLQPLMVFFKEGGDKQGSTISEHRGGGY